MANRLFSRINFQVSATIATATRRFHGEVENISMNGMFMVTDEQLQPGEAVDISILLNGASPEIDITISARVSRIVAEGIAFTFDKIDLDSYTHLKNIVTYNSDDADKILEEINHAIDEKIAVET